MLFLLFFFLQTLRKSLEADESIRESIQAARKVWDTVTNTVIVPKAINLLKPFEQHINVWVSCGFLGVLLLFKHNNESGFMFVRMISKHVQ